VAWGWAVNGFAPVVGSVLTTLLSMTFGFRAIMVLAWCTYAVAIIALRFLLKAVQNAPVADEPDVRVADDEPQLVPTAT